MGKINIDKINSYEPINAARQAGVKKSGKETGAAAIESKKAVNEDKLELSNRASEVGKFVEQLKELPDVREEKVSGLREQISSGSYQPSGEDIADAILKDEQS